MSRESLDQIACRYGTDKSCLASLPVAADGYSSRPPQGHGYSIFYQHYFEAMRDLPIRLLEIGVLDGRSLASWADYFPKAKLYGLDIDPDCARFQGERTHIFTGGQTDPALLARVRKEVPEGFDIIIDDGSHYVDHVIASFGELFPHLRANGIYVVEDLHVCRDPQWGKVAWNRGMDMHRESQGNDPARMVAFLKQARSNPLVRALTVHLKKICFIEKRAEQEGRVDLPVRGDALDDLAVVPRRQGILVRSALAMRKALGAR